MSTINGAESSRELKLICSLVRKWESQPLRPTLATGNPPGIPAFSRGEKPARKLATGQITALFGSLREGGGQPDPRVFLGAPPHVSRHRARFPVRSWVALSIFQREEVRTEEALRRRCPSSIRREEALRRHRPPQVSAAPSLRQPLASCNSSW